MPRAGFSPGIATHCPHPSGAGEEAGGRAGWGLRGGIYEFRRLRGGGSPPPRTSRTRGTMEQSRGASQSPISHRARSLDGGINTHPVFTPSRVRLVIRP
jgi:hypothetical protein